MTLTSLVPRGVVSQEEDHAHRRKLPLSSRWIRPDRRGARGRDTARFDPLGHDIVRLECDRKRIRRIHFAEQQHFDPDSRVVSTLPLTLMVKFLGDGIGGEVREAAAGLRFRHIRLIFLRLAQPHVSSNASIYIPDPELCVTRMYEPKNRSPRMAPPEETSLVVEVPCFTDDPIYATPTEDLATRVIRRTRQHRDHQNFEGAGMASSLLCPTRIRSTRLTMRHASRRSSTRSALSRTLI